MAESIQELVKNRRDLIAVHKKNDFTDGIHALLTDLYPDTAHFIYELLQNAEDMNATTVRFELDHNGIYFEHNGSKRTFNLDDIDAITNIGHNRQKKDDPTTIGKFGVGFKAVFAYTSTPEIQSGEYHFQIKDYFVPDFKSKKYIKKAKIKDTLNTRFYFPFNNPQKPVEVAYSETLQGLKALNDTSILFLQNINRIEFAISKKEVGFVERLDGDRHFVTIRCKSHDSKIVSESTWLKFSALEEIFDEQGNLKKLPIAIAYAIKEDERSKKISIVPVKGGGRTFIYFPAEKEYSGLRFHINAPFASTVARDSVRNCDDNIKLIKKIAQLAANSLQTIKDLGLINYSFFETLPNEKENIPPFYQYIFDYIYTAFRKNDFLPTKDGDFVSSINALSGPASISNLFGNEDMQFLFGIDKKWIPVALKNSRADAFIQSLGIENFGYSRFITAFSVSNRRNLEDLLGDKKIDWLRNFYILCAEVSDALDTGKRTLFIQDAKTTAFIQSTKKKFFRPTDIYILPPNATVLGKTTPIVNTRLMDASKTNRSGEKINRFFASVLGIAEYGPRIEILSLLEKYHDSIIADEDYFNAMLAFAQYGESHSDINFTEYKIFLYSNQQAAPSNDYASHLFIGVQYGNADGSKLAKAYGDHTLSGLYAKFYDKKQLKQFVSFASRCGARGELQIAECDAMYNPQFKDKLWVDGKFTSQGTNADYTIDRIQELLKQNSVDISKIIWNTLLKFGKGPWCQYTTAKFSPNGTNSTRTCDSTLVYYLKKNAWIPNKKGTLCKPSELQISDLRKDFPFDAANKLIVALEIGKTSDEAENKYAHLIKKMESAGLHVISEEEFRKFEEWKRLESQETEVAPISTDALLKKQVKRKKADSDDADAISETNVEETFKNAKKMKPSTKKLFSKIESSSKEEKSLLQKWYQGHCQMCDTSIIGHSGNPHFVARNVINTQHLAVEIRKTTDLAWNSLCLCPNCAAKYNVCTRDISNLYKQILTKRIPKDDTVPMILTIELDGKSQEIRYALDHFLALRKAFKLIDELAETQEK